MWYPTLKHERFFSTKKKLILQQFRRRVARLIIKLAKSWVYEQLLGIYKNQELEKNQ